MTREEAIDMLYGMKADNLNLDDAYTKDKYDALEMAIQALEQESSGDLISRQAALDAMYELCNTGETLEENPWRDNPHIDAITDAINNLQPIKPQDCDICEVGSPCLYCKHEFEPQERSDKE